MNIHEYQAKALFRDYNIPVARGEVAYTPNEAELAARALGTPDVVVKAQIHAGGRGKAGGVKRARDYSEVYSHANNMLGTHLVTKQTSPEGQKVLKVYVEEASDIGEELYLSMMVNRTTGRIGIIASAAGGMDIEEVALREPQKITKIDIDPAVGISAFHIRVIAKALNLQGDLAKQLSSLMANLYRLFSENDINMIEINPLIITKAGGLLALDAKISFDDNGLFRHPHISNLRDEAEEDPIELKANTYHLNYVKLDGNIGCMVNGAGLAMATMDIIQLYGEMPANFLDVGGGADRERVTNAFKLILSDKKVEAVLVNIFGGIMRCDIIADGIVAAANELGLNVPLVVRLEGTNVEIGKKILSESGLSIIAANSMADAAEKVVQAIRRQK